MDAATAYQLLLAAIKSIAARSKAGKTTLLATDRKAIVTATDYLGSIGMLHSLSAGTSGTIPVSTQDTLAPIIVTGLTATASGSDAMNLTWDASCDIPQSGASVSGVSQYILKRDGSTVATISASSGLSPTYTTEDIGSPSSAGSGVQSGGNWTIISYGTGITGTSDQFTFTYTTTTGDVVVIAKVLAFTSSSDSAKSGVMIRQSLSADAPFVHACPFPQAQGKGVGLRYRATSGAAAQSPATIASIGQPCWVKLVKQGSSTFTGYYSTDGNTWVSLGSATVAMSGTIYCGAAVSSVTGFGSVSSGVEQLSTQNLGTITYTDTGLLPATAYSYTVTAKDGAGNSASASVARSGTTDAATGTSWDAYDPISDPADFGFVSGNTDLYIINTLSTSVGSATSVGTRTWTCSLGYFDSLSSPRVGIFSVSGTIKMERSVYARGRHSLCGQTAPSPGVAFGNYRRRLAGSGQLMEHLSNYAGAAARPDGNDDLDNRDGVQLGDDYDATATDTTVARNLTLIGAVDEGIENFGASTRGTAISCIIACPLQYGKGPGDAHATGSIVGDVPTQARYLRNLYSGGNYRLPLYSRGTTVTMANCAAHNSGTADTVGYNYNEWLTLGRNLKSSYGMGWSDEATFTNVVGNQFVVGPQTVVDTYCIGVNFDGQGNAVAGSRLYVSGNVPIGFDGALSSSSQTSLINDQQPSAPSGYYASSVITSAWPTGYTAHVITDTPSGNLEFANLIASTAGSRPADRVAGIDSYVVTSYLNSVQGNSANNTIILDDLADLNASYPGGGDARGYPNFTNNSVNLFDSASMDGDPLITVEAGRDTVEGNGKTWLYNWLRRWSVNWGGST